MTYNNENQDDFKTTGGGKTGFYAGGTAGNTTKLQTSSGLEKVESYSEAFAKIEAATGIRDIDELVNNFIKAEENNFALFKFVNELSNDIENLEA
jgi:hypothetical protein